MEKVSVLSPRVHINRSLAQEEGSLWLAEWAFPVIEFCSHPLIMASCHILDCSAKNLRLCSTDVGLGHATCFDLCSVGKVPVLHSRFNGHCGFMLASPGPL